MSGHPRLRGQAMLEFGLALPLLVIVMVMFLELGRIVYYYSALNHAVREGARFAIVHHFSSNDEALLAIRPKVVGSAFGMPLAGNDVTAHCGLPPVGNTDYPCQDYMTVSAQMDVSPMVPLMARILGSGTAYHLHAESVMQMTPLGECGDCNEP